MKTVIAAIALLTAAGLLQPADAAPGKIKPKPANVAKPAPARPSGVQAVRDLIYARPVSGHPLTLDIYQPQRAPKDFPRPVVIFIHGGNWNSGDARQGGGFNDFPAILTSVAAQGYVVASINYRFSGEAPFPAPVQDAKTAVRWLRAHAADYNIDTTRVALWGEEAGGQIAALVATGCGVSSLAPEGPRDDNAPSDCVQAVIDWHGIHDLAGMTMGEDGKPLPVPTPEGTYLGCEPAQCAPGVVRAASPMAYIGPNTPPFLIQHGSHKTVPLVQSQKLFDALRRAHVPVEYVTYADGETDVASRAMDKVAAFLAQTFPRKPINKKPPRITSNALPY